MRTSKSFGQVLFSVVRDFSLIFFGTVMFPNVYHRGSDYRRKPCPSTIFNKILCTNPATTYHKGAKVLVKS